MPGKLTVAALCLFAFQLLPLTLFADTWQVHPYPWGGGDFDTIQEAIDAAQDGDVILVGPSTYIENINFLGKAITVVSEYGPTVTTIMPQGDASIVTFDSGEGSDSIFDGFTLTADFTFQDVQGAGIHCGSNASPTIQNNTITGLVVSQTIGSPLLHGGGIYCGTSSSPTISNNTIFDISMGNTALGAGVYCAEDSSVTLHDNTIIFCAVNEGSGGGIYCAAGSTCSIFNNLISNNNLPGASGGGLAASGCAVCIEGNSFVGNGSGLYGGAMALGGCYGTIADNEFVSNGCGQFGGAISLQGCTLTVSDNLFDGNSGPDAAVIGTLVTGAPYAVEFDGNVVSNNTVFYSGIVSQVESATDCLFQGNSSQYGPALSCEGPITHSVFQDNIAYPGFVRDASATGVIEGCTFYGDSTGGTALAATSNVINCILYGPPLSPSPIPSGAAVTYSDVQGGYPGTGNIDVDPLFADPVAGDFSLLPGSPCIDTGDPASDVDPDGTIADMGAFPYYQWPFIRGDANQDGTLDISDPVATLDLLFGSGTTDCLVAMDCNDDEAVDVADVSYSLGAIFGFGPEPSSPFQSCGLDPTLGGLGCQEYDGCP